MDCRKLWQVIEQSIFAYDLDDIAKGAVKYVKLASDTARDLSISDMIDVVLRFCKLLTSKSNCSEYMSAFILPILHEVITSNEEFGDKAMLAYLEIAAMLDVDYFRKKQLHKIKSFVRDERERVRSSVARHLAALCGVYCDDWFADLKEMIASLSCDSSASVRAGVPAIVSKYTEKIGDGRLADVFGKLAKDKAAEVRAAVVRVCSDMVQASKDRKSVWEVIVKLVADKSGLVAAAVNLEIGRILAHAHAGEAANSLVKRYRSVSIAGTSEEQYQAAFYFPGVVIALGDKVAEYVKEIFYHFLAHDEVRVRRTLAFGFWSYSRRFSDDEVKNVVLRLLADDERVSVGVLTNMNHIVGELDDRKAITDWLIGTNAFPREWRTRKVIVEQLRYCCEPSEQSFAKALEFLHDDVAAVRDEAVRSCIKLYTPACDDQIMSLVTSSSYRDRIAFCKIVEEVQSPGLRNGLKALVQDPVSMVQQHAMEAMRNT